MLTDPISIIRYKHHINRILLSLLLSLSPCIGYAVPQFTHTASNATPGKDPRTTIFISGQISAQDPTIVINASTKAFFTYLEKQLQIRFSVIQYPWARALEATERSEGMLFGVYKTKEREKKFVFSEAIFADTIWLIMRCDTNFPVNSMQDLQGKTISMHTGSSVTEEFNRGINTIFKVDYSTTDIPGTFNRLAQRRMDAFIFYEPTPGKIDDELATYNAAFTKTKNRDIDKSSPIFCKSNKPLAKLNNYFAISKQMDRSVLDKVNQIILSARKNGDLENIFSK